MPREFDMVAVSMPDGRLFQPSREKYDAVQIAIIEQFAPRFAPGAVVLHLGNRTNRILPKAQQIMKKLGVSFDQLDMLPSVLLWNQKRNCLILIDAAVAHGPLSPNRISELNKLLENCTAARLFVGVFSNMDEFTEHQDSIAWKTHAWLIDAPNHMIHLD